MHVNALLSFLATVSYTLATVDKRQIAATTITDSNGNTLVNSGISADSSMTMTAVASTSATRPPGAESSLAIVIDGSTMYESGDVTAGPGETAGRSGDSTSIATVQSARTDSSSARGPKITQAPMLVGGIAAIAFFAV